jgi:hypothetical protein
LDRMIESLLKKFRIARELGGLNDDQLFECLAAHCVLSEFYENDFDPDEFRMGGPYDFGIDAAAVIVNGRMYTDPTELKDAVANAGHISVQFVVIQAKKSAGFRSNVFTELSQNLIDLFSERPFKRQCSADVKKLIGCIDVVYSDLGKLSDNPQLIVSYVASGTPRASALEPARSAASHKL